MHNADSNPNSIFDSALLQERLRRAKARAINGADFLLQRAADDLEERLSLVERKFAQAIEINSYGDQVRERLMRSGKVENVTAIAQQIAGTGQGSIQGSTQDTTQDTTPGLTEYLPLEPQSADLIVSLLSLHLTNDTPGMMIQIRQALKPDGLFLGAMAGAGTLGELRESLLQAESELTGGVTPRVAPFADVRDGGSLLQRAGFALPVTDIETVTVRYDHLFALMNDLRAMGMANSLIARSRKPVSKRFFMRAAEIYAERFSDPDGRIRATFSFIWMSGWAPHESQQKPLKPGSAKTSLASALGTVEKKPE